MDKIQKNKQVMGNSVTQTCTDYNTTWNTSALFTDSVDEHNDNMTDISNWEQKQQEAMEIRGLVQDKNLLRLVMVDTLVVRIISGIKAYAAAISDSQLASSVNFSRSKLLKMSDQAFVTATNIVKTVANENAAALVDYGITALMLTNFATDITSFTSINNKPKTLRGQVKVYTANLQIAVSKMVRFLKEKMDNQVRSLFQGTDFFSAYYNSRKVYHFNESRTILKGTVKDANTEAPVRNAIIEMVNYPAPGQSLFRHTNYDGNYAYKELTLSTAIIRVRAVGYTVAEYTVTIKDKQTTDFDIMLIPDPAAVPVPA